MYSTANSIDPQILKTKNRKKNYAENVFKYVIDLQ